MKPTGEHKIVHAVSRPGDLVTVLRGQEGTTAMPFTVGDRAELRLTAAEMPSHNHAGTTGSQSANHHHNFSTSSIGGGGAQQRAAYAGD